MTSKAAPAPWGFESSEKPGGYGNHNMYITDADGRKIAAVWGKRGEKDATAAMMIGSLAMAAALEKIIEMNVQYCIDREGDAAKAETMACVRIARAALAEARGGR